jgi:hypothetical protein
VDRGNLGEDEFANFEAPDDTRDSKSSFALQSSNCIEAVIL